MSQTVEDLKERVERINTVFNKLLENWDDLELHVQTQLTTGVNKAYGQAASFEHEYETVTAAERKGRLVITQTHADVTIGEADSLFAKSVEAKSLTAPTKGAANLLITKAINQVAGETGSMPREKDVRIIDLKIDGSNPWPAPGGGYGLPRPEVSLEDLQKWAKEELWEITGGNSPVPGASVLMDWLNDEQHGSKKFTNPKIVVASFDKKFSESNFYSSRLLVANAKKTSFTHLRCLTIKIRYHKPYVTYKTENKAKPIHLEELIYQIFKDTSSTKAKIELAKIKYRVPEKDDKVRRKFFLNQNR